MTLSLCRLRDVAVLTVIACGVGTEPVRAQQPAQPTSEPALQATIQAQVPIGDVVYVTDATGAALKGKLASVTSDAVVVRVASEMRQVSARDIRRIDWQQRDSVLNGLLIGAAVGAAPGVYWLAADPNECTGMCPEEYAFIAVGAVVGGLIDRIVTRKVAVYSTESSSRRPRIGVAPIVKRTRHGVEIAIAF